jgi:hypothetical protein
LQQVGTGPDIDRRAMQSPAPHPVLRTTLASLGASDLTESTRSRATARAETERITSIYGKLASAPTAQVEDIHSKIVAPDRTGSLPPACWLAPGQIGGSARAVEVRDMVAHAAELEALDGPCWLQASPAALRTCLELGGPRA